MPLLFPKKEKKREDRRRHYQGVTRLCVAHAPPLGSARGEMGKLHSCSLCTNELSIIENGKHLFCEHEGFGWINYRTTAAKWKQKVQHHSCVAHYPLTNCYQGLANGAMGHHSGSMLLTQPTQTSYKHPQVDVCVCMPPQTWIHIHAQPHTTCQSSHLLNTLYYVILVTFRQ